MIRINRSDARRYFSRLVLLRDKIEMHHSRLPLKFVMASFTFRNQLNVVDRIAKSIKKQIQFVSSIKNDTNSKCLLADRSALRESHRASSSEICSMSLALPDLKWGDRRSA